jgi:uroporphyrinogen-III synthase
MATILVIRTEDSFSQQLRQAGYDVVNLELIETKPIEDLSEFRDKLAKLNDYDGIFFTSPVAAEIFVKERRNSNGFSGNVYALGQRARSVLASAGIRTKLFAGSNTAEELLSAFGKGEFAGKRFLFIRGERSLRTIPESLSDIAEIDEIAVYKTETPEISDDKLGDLRSRLTKGEIGSVCFFSPSGVERFAQLFGDAVNVVNAAVIGTTTEQAARRAGFNVSVVAPKANASEFAKSLIEHLKNIE